MEPSAINMSDLDNLKVDLGHAEAQLGLFEEKQRTL